MTVDEPSEFGLRVTPSERAAGRTEEEPHVCGCWVIDLVLGKS